MTVTPSIRLAITRPGDADALSVGLSMSPDVLFINAASAPYSAVGDGVTDTTAALQAAINAAHSLGGGTVFLPAGTYAFTQLTLYDNIRLLGVGRWLTTLKCIGPDSAGSAVLNGGGKTGIEIEHLTLDGNDQDFATFGVYITGNGWDKWSAVRHCRIINFTTENGAGAGQGVYSWTAQKLLVEDCYFVNNIIDVFMDSAHKDAHVRNCHFWSEGGFTGRRKAIQFAGGDDGGGLIEGNVISDVGSDPSGIGIDGHGINLVNTKRVRCHGNTIDNAIVAGIHIGDGSYDAKIVGNTVMNCGLGIYAEVTFGETALATDGSGVGCIVADNTVGNINGYGISLSYSPGTTCRGNHVHDCLHEGIFCDSDRVTITDNHVWNCYTSNDAPNPASTPNVQAQIRVTIPSKCRVVGNQVFYTTTVTVPDYAIACGDGGHIIKDNICTGGYVTAAVDSVGSTNTVAGNVA